MKKRKMPSHTLKEEQEHIWQSPELSVVLINIHFRNTLTLFRIAVDIGYDDELRSFEQFVSRQIGL